MHNFATKKDDTKGIIANLKKYGISIMENYLSGDSLKLIEEEFYSLKEAFKSHEKTLINDESWLVRARPSELREKGFNEILSHMKNEVFLSVASDFYRPHEFGLEQVYAHHDVNKMPYSNFWHQDNTGVIKFYFYLNDVDKNNGAFKYNLGSHREGYLRVMLKRLGGNLNSHFRIPEEALLNPVDVEAPRGSLVVFNTNGAHSAGSFSKEGHRDIIRYHFCTPETYADKVIRRKRLYWLVHRFLPSYTLHEARIDNGHASQEFMPPYET